MTFSSHAQQAAGRVDRRRRDGVLGATASGLVFGMSGSDISKRKATPDAAAQDARPAKDSSLVRAEPAQKDEGDAAWRMEAGARVKRRLAVIASTEARNGALRTHMRRLDATITSMSGCPSPVLSLVPPLSLCPLPPSDFARPCSFHPLALRPALPSLPPRHTVSARLGSPSVPRPCRCSVQCLDAY